MRRIGSTATTAAPARDRHVPPLVLLGALACAACGGDRGGEEAARAAQLEFVEAASAAIESQLESAPAPDDPRAAAVWAQVVELYAARDHRPLWLDHRGPTSRGRELVAELLGAARHGLDPAISGGERLALAVADPRHRDDRGAGDGAERAARLDPSLTHAFLLLAEHLGRGRVRPGDAGIHWETERRAIDLAKVAAAAVEHGAAAALAAVRPAHDEYARLERLLVPYRRVVGAGGWPVVPEGETLEPGDEDAARVPLLRRRLAAEGYATGDESGGTEGRGGPSAVYDDALAAAVREYQRRRGLTPDGVVGGRTLDELNVPAVDRVRQIEANLERWRWIPADLGDRYVLVNVPRFELQVVEEGDEVMRMRVVVGEELNATPMFSDRMEYVVFNPYWNIPASIAGEEIVPQLRRDRGYLARNQMEVVRGWEDVEVLGSWVPPAVAAQAADESSGLRIRQRPGPENPLGQIKFMFPNEHAIYLHDTSAGHLFDETVRLFSHGCIRIEKPVELASWALGRPPAEIRAAMAGSSGDEWETLPRQIPVHILYYTVAVDDDGRALFFDDFYGIDEQVLAAIDRQPASELPLVDG